MSEKKCPSCGAAIDFNATECRYCGEAMVVDSPQYQQINSQPIIVNTQQTNATSNFAYLKPYYQEQFQGIEASGGTYRGKWNWCAFLFSWIWGFTKGLWGLSLVTIVLNIILSNMRIGWLSMGVAIFWGIMGNYFYYNLQKNHKQFPSKL
jgi:hypothetical protein